MIVLTTTAALDISYQIDDCFETASGSQVIMKMKISKSNIEMVLIGVRG